MGANPDEIHLKQFANVYLHLLSKKINVQEEFLHLNHRISSRSKKVNLHDAVLWKIWFSSFDRKWGSAEYLDHFSWVLTYITLIIIKSCHEFQSSLEIDYTHVYMCFKIELSGKLFCKHVPISSFFLFYFLSIEGLFFRLIRSISKFVFCGSMWQDFVHFLCVLICPAEDVISSNLWMLNTSWSCWLKEIGCGPRSNFILWEKIYFRHLLNWPENVLL